MNERWTLSQFLGRYEHALAKLEQRGLMVQNTRLSRYAKCIQQGVEQESRGDLSHQTTDSFVNALVEAFDIIYIAQLPTELFVDDHALRKLRNLSKGPDAMMPDRQDPARDDALELVVLAMVVANGVWASFSTSGGDLVVGESRWPVECKRISSMKSLEKQLRKARAQLEVQASKGSPPGLICIDVTNPIRTERGSIHVQADEALNEAADDRLLAYMTHGFDLNMTDILRGTSVLGVVFRYWSHGTAGDAANIRVAPSFQLVSNHDPDSPGHAQFIRAVEGFGGGRIVDATSDDIAKARELFADRRAKRS